MTKVVRLMPRPLHFLAAFTTVALIAATPAVVAAPAPTHGGGASPGDVPSGRRGTQTPDTSTALAPLGLQRAVLEQAGDDLRWETTTNAAWSPASLRRNGQTLCLRLVYATSGVNSRDVCVRRRGAKATLTLQRVLTSGGHGPVHELRATIARHSKRELTATFSAAAIGIPDTASVRWRTLSSTDGCDVGEDGDCFRARPQNGAVLQLRSPVPIGCTPAGPAYVTNGSRARRVVALTFDDGPSPYTAGFLDVLRAKGVKGTFFQIGQQVSSYASLEQRILAEGHELANHTWSHATVSAGGSLASSQINATTSAIQNASGFRPCAFRAPGRRHKLLARQPRARPRLLDDRVGRRPAGLAHARHRRDLLADRQRHPQRLDHPDARRRRQPLADARRAAARDRHAQSARLRLRHDPRDHRRETDVPLISL